MTKNNLQGNNFPLINIEYLNETQLAERWNVSKKLIQKLRYNGGGPQFLKIGHSVRYSIKTIELYESQHQFAHTSQQEKSNG